MGIPAAVLGGEVAAKEAKGIVQSIINALNQPIVHFTWSRDPKNYKAIRLQSVDLNVTTGLILGAVLLGLGWEAANWFAQAFNKSGQVIEDIGIALLKFEELELETLFKLSSLFSPTEPLGSGEHGRIPAPGHGPKKVVKVPATFGAAYNRMMRDLTVALPGSGAQLIRNVIASMGNPPPAPTHHSQ